MIKVIIIAILCSIVAAFPQNRGNSSQLHRLLEEAFLEEGQKDFMDFGASVKASANYKSRKKRASDTEYDYYKDMDYYNYYGVEDPYYDEKKANATAFNFEKILDTGTQVTIVLCVIGLLLLYCVWQVLCYPALKLCGWYCTYWGTIVRMAFDSCMGRDPRYRMMEKMVTSMGFAMPSYSEWKQWMAAYEDMMLQMAEGQAEGITDMVKGVRGAVGPMKTMMGQGMDQAGNVGAVMAGIGDGLSDYMSGMPTGGLMF